jgi:hypothetical protein
MAGTKGASSRAPLAPAAPDTHTTKKITPKNFRMKIMYRISLTRARSREFLGRGIFRRIFAAQKPGYPLQFLKKCLRHFSAGFPLLSLARTGAPPPNPRREAENPPSHTKKVYMGMHFTQA